MRRHRAERKPAKLTSAPLKVGDKVAVVLRCFATGLGEARKHHRQHWQSSRCFADRSWHGSASKWSAWRNTEVFLLDLHFGFVNLDQAVSTMADEQASIWLLKSESNEDVSDIKSPNLVQTRLRKRNAYPKSFRYKNYFAWITVISFILLNNILWYIASQHSLLLYDESLLRFGRFDPSKNSTYRKCLCIYIHIVS